MTLLLFNRMGIYDNDIYKSILLRSLPKCSFFGEYKSFNVTYYTVTINFKAVRFESNMNALDGCEWSMGQVEAAYYVQATDGSPMEGHTSFGDVQTMGKGGPVNQLRFGTITRQIVSGGEAVSSSRNSTSNSPKAMSTPILDVYLYVYIPS